MPGVNLQLARLLQNLGTITWNTAAVTLNGTQHHQSPERRAGVLTNLTLNESAPAAGSSSMRTLTKTGPLGPTTITGIRDVVFSNLWRASGFGSARRAIPSCRIGR
jgi:hypothetical protein